MTRPAIVQTTFDFAVREINALETRIVTAEDDADAMLWEQAAQVVAQLKAGRTQQQIADQWVNARTGEFYSQVHVSRVQKTFYTFTYKVPRPRFRDAFNEIANAGAPHVSHNSGNNEWYTPAEYIEAARRVMNDGIDLDPATTEAANDVIKAAQIFTAADDGLKQEWSGRVWLNPPYAQPIIGKFISKLVAHVQANDLEAAIVLVNNATDTEWFQEMGAFADAICFKNGRIKFWGPDGMEGSPLQGQAFLYFGTETWRFVKHFSAFGSILVRP
jgi:phage N-6-adenine-methyltransferase